MNTPRFFPLIVTGMHRSGLSWVASEINRNCAAQSKMTGCFEDEDFLALQRRMIMSCCNSKDVGQHDWGWTEHEQFERGAWAQFFPEARQLLSQREWTSTCWGWKDPRTTLLLDFWEALIPTARYVLVYRFPWDVADSIQRLGVDIFLRQPKYAFRTWLFYNRQMLNFYHRHSERCLLLSANALSKAPHQLLALLESKLGMTVGEGDGDNSFDPGWFKTIEGADPLIDLLGAASPEIITMLKELDAGADISSSSLWRAESPRARLLRPDQSTNDSVQVSIVIPSYDQGQLLLEAVASAERCAPPQSELIIVDDGSEDQHTLDILQVLRAGGYFVHQQLHGGHVAALNTAVSLSRGDYVLPLAHDNILCPGFIEAAIDILDTDSLVGVVYGNYHIFGLYSAVRNVPSFDLDKLLLSNYIDASSIFRKKVWIDCGGYDAAMFYEDWEFWINAASLGWQFYKVDQITFNYRVRPNSLLAQVSSHELLKRQTAYLIRKHSRLYLTGDRWIDYLSEMWPRFNDYDRLIAERNAAEQSLRVLSAQLEAIYGSKHWRIMSWYWTFLAQARKVFYQFKLWMFNVRQFFI